ncbi:MAG: diguanylate cyclase [Cyanobacteria bacterium P01_F01_bin.42]
MNRTQDSTAFQLHPQPDDVQPQNQETLDDDVLLFDDEPDHRGDTPHESVTWKVLVVDDDEQVHSVTRLALKNFKFDDKRLEILSAYSAAQARKVLEKNQDTAVIFLDVVMESDEAGLELIHYIRRNLNNQQIRIILRTGQPGSVPELSIVEGYDINDYKTKTELTQAKLFSALVTAIRSYRDIVTVEQSRHEIELLNRRLVDFNQELERQVELRTQELQEKNRRLEQEIKARMQTQRRLESVNNQLDKANRKLSFWANFDELTTLSNRRCFDKYLGQLWRQAFRDQNPICIVLADIDYFKQYNDNYGHLAGDECLKKVGLAFRDIVERPLDLAARYGGEEFVVVLHDTDMDGGEVVAERLRAAIQELKLPHKYSSVSDYISMSFGVSALVPSPKMSHEALLARADGALYRAKQAGRNQVLQHQSEED